MARKKGGEEAAVGGSAIPAVSPSDLPALLDISMLTPGLAGVQGLPLLLWGQPGSSKTASLYAAAARHRYHCEVVLLGTYESSDVLGWLLPREQAGSTTMERVAPGWARRLARAAAGEMTLSNGERARGGLLFLDELSCAPPSTQGAGLRVLQERVVGDLSLAKVACVAAANPEDTAAGGGVLSAPSANRMLHASYAPDLEGWVAYLARHTRSDGTKPRIWNEERWDDAWGRAVTAVAGYLKTQPNRFSDGLPTDEAERGGPWGSARSWEMAIRALAGADALGFTADRIRRLVVGAAVGAPVAAEFMEYASTLDLPTPAGLVSGKEKLPPRADQQYACCVALLTWALAPKDLKERRERVGGALGVAIRIAGNGHADIAANLVRDLPYDDMTAATSDPKIGNALMSSPLRAVAVAFDEAKRAR